MKFLTVVGARPQFIKAAPVSRALRAAGHTEHLTHTGQHYDRQMSRIFFEEMQIPEPDINLEVGSGSHATQTAQMLTKLEGVMQQRRTELLRNSDQFRRIRLQPRRRIDKPFSLGVTRANHQGRRSAPLEFSDLS